jgi:hypothetical protein
MVEGLQMNGVVLIPNKLYGIPTFLESQTILCLTKIIENITKIYDTK